MKIRRKSRDSVSPPERSTAFCMHCGQKIAEECQFCPYCGKKLPRVPEPQPQSAPQPKPEPKPVTPPKPRSNPVQSSALRCPKDDLVIIDDGTDWHCGREYLLKVAKMVFHDDPAPFLFLPPGDDNRIAAICMLARFIADDPEKTFEENTERYHWWKLFEYRRYALGYGSTTRSTCYDGGCYSDDGERHHYTTIQKCSIKEFLDARKKAMKGSFHFGHGVDSQRFDFSVDSSSRTCVHYFRNWCGLKGCYKIDGDTRYEEPKTPAAVDEYSDWQCGKERLIELSRIVFPENADNPRELSTMLELLEKYAQKIDWGDAGIEFSDNTKYEFNRHADTPRELLGKWDLLDKYREFMDGSDKGVKSVFHTKYEFNRHAITAEWSVHGWDDYFDDDCGKNIETWICDHRRVICKIDRNEYEQAKASSVKINTVMVDNGETLKVDNGEALMLSSIWAGARIYYYKDYMGLNGYYKLYETESYSRDETIAQT